MATRSVLGLMCVLKGLREQGLDISPLLDRFGLDLDSMSPAARIDRDLELQIYVFISGMVDDPLAGLRAGTYVGFAGYGPLTMLFMTAANAYEAIREGLRYQPLTYLYSTLAFEPGNDLSALILKPLQLEGKAFRFRVDSEMSGTYKLLKDMQNALGFAFNVMRVDLPYPRPQDASAYTSYYNCDVHFGTQDARFWLRNENLQNAFPTADPVAHEYYRAQCEQLMRAHASETRSTLADRIRNYLRLYNEGYPDSTAVAQALGMSERSLRRQLSEENISFRQLREEVRYRHARELLSGGLPVDEIARQLGYAESASFIHAFQRWAGQSPAAWRRNKPDADTHATPASLN